MFRWNEEKVSGTEKSVLGGGVARGLAPVAEEGKGVRSIIGGLGMISEVE